MFTGHEGVVSTPFTGPPRFYGIYLCSNVLSPSDTDFPMMFIYLSWTFRLVFRALQICYLISLISLNRGHKHCSDFFLNCYLISLISLSYRIKQFRIGSLNLYLISLISLSRRDRNLSALARNLYLI